jgi:hypothetical protein
MNRKRDLYLLSEAYTKVNEGMRVVGTGTVQPDDTVTPNEGPGGVLEIQPDGQHPEPPKQDENAEGGGGPQEGEDWRAHMTRNIVAKGSEFLRSVYELGYTGEAGDADINEVVALLAQEAEADERLKQAIEAVVVHLVNAGQADH